MSYTPNNWQTGDIITAEKLNNMEQGISSAAKLANVFMAAVGFDTGTKNFCWVAYGLKDTRPDHDGSWTLIESLGDDNVIIGDDAPFKSILPAVIIPQNDYMRPFIILPANVAANVEGSIGEQMIVYLQEGSTANAHMIDGDGNITFYGTL